MIAGVGVRSRPERRSSPARCLIGASRAPESRLLRTL